MDKDQLIGIVAERLALKLQSCNCTKPSAESLAPSIKHELLCSVLDALVAGHPILIKNGTVIPKITALTRAQLFALLEASYAHIPAPATLTAMLKRRGVRPFVSEKSNDRRHRFYIDGRQTMCYAFNTSIRTDAELLKQIEKFKQLLLPK